MKIKEKYSKEDLKDIGIGKCIVVSEKEVSDGDIVYVASTPHFKYNGYQKNSTRAYVWENGEISLLFSDTTNHRAKKAIKAYRNGDVGNVISHEIWNNYITNGHSTRRGLYADYSVKKIDRIKEIHKSHINYLETGNAKEDHCNRVLLRNR